MKVNNPVQLKIAVIGKKECGKSALTFRFVSSKFIKEYEKTIEDSYTIKRNIDDIDCQLYIIDTSGEEEYKSMQDLWINTAEAFLLVYSIDNKESFDEIKTKCTKIKNLRSNGGKYFITIMGNKCDMESRRVVERRDVEKYCDQQKVFFLEGSAKDNINVNEAFLSLVKNFLKMKFPENYSEKQLENKKTCYCF